MNHKVFVSYSHRDKESTDNICKLLTENGIEYWIDVKSNRAGSNYKVAVVDAIDASKVVIFVSSKNSNSPDSSVLREIEYAINRKKIVIPVLLDDTNYAKSVILDLYNIHRIDFQNKTEESCLDLIKSIMHYL